MSPYKVIRTIHKERRDSGGMFEDTLGVEEVERPGTMRFRAFASGGFGGGVQCFRATEEEALAELERLYNKLHGYENEDN